jgi:hypothetical protein
VTADNIIPRENDTQSWNRYSYCSNNPIAYKDPTGHYEKDVHHDLTYFLAVKAGIDSDTAGIIAQYNQYTDEDKDTKSMVVDKPWTGDKYEKQRQSYHFASNERLTELDKNVTGINEKGTNYDPKEIGTYLHVMQDSKYSHKEFVDKGETKHLTTAPDKTYNDPEKANKMANETFDYLKKASGTNYQLTKEDLQVIDAFNKEKDENKKKEILEKALGNKQKLPEYAAPQNMKRENDRWVQE